MDNRGFDDLARVFAASAGHAGSRRRFLAGLAGLAAGLVATGPARDAGAANCGPAQVERRGVGCVCKATGRPPHANGECPCPKGKIRCGDACADLGSDAAHCGACGANCLALVPNAAAAVCEQGACRATNCAAGWADCDGDPTNGCETPLGTDSDCGACGDVCDGPSERCGGGGQAGICGCADDGTACGAAVCGTATNNCGETVACGPLDGACPFNQVCADGGCGCPSGFVLANGSCFRIDTPGGVCSGCDFGIDGSVFGSNADRICANSVRTDCGGGISCSVSCEAGVCAAGQVCFPSTNRCLRPC